MKTDLSLNLNSFKSWEMLLLILLLFSNLRISAQPATYTFDKSARICFVGNSITYTGGFHHDIQTFYITRYPNRKMTFFNCGIPGDVATHVLDRMDDDILIHKPTHVVLMLGMNDINRSLYRPGPVLDTDTLKKRKDALLKYEMNVEKIVNIFLSKNIKVILQKPTIYDQTAIMPAFNNFGVNDALKSCGGFIEELADKYGLPVIDYWTVMDKINSEIQKNNSSATIVGEDRVHPGATGHFIMAYEFLKTMNHPQYVSKIIIDKNINRSQKRSSNCTILTLDRTKDGIVFSVKENSLPFPATNNPQEALKYVNFIDDFNVEMLQINDLAPGAYQLSIDDTIIGVFLQDQLGKGVNLAEYGSTPQNCQSIRVWNTLTKRWEVEETLRGLRFIEYRPHLKKLNDSGNNAGISPWVRTQIDNYVKNKPQQKELENKLANYLDDAYHAAQPIVHRYNIKSIN